MFHKLLKIFIWATISLCAAAGEEGLDQSISILLFGNYEFLNVTGFISSLMRIYNIGIISVLTVTAIGSLAYLGALAASEGKGIGRKISGWVAVRTLIGFTLLVPLGPSSISGVQHMVVAIVNSSIQATEFMAKQLAGSPTPLLMDSGVKSEDVAAVYTDIVKMALCNISLSNNAPYEIAHGSGAYFFKTAGLAEQSNVCGTITATKSFAAERVLTSIYNDTQTWFKLAESAVNLQEERHKAQVILQVQGVAINREEAFNTIVVPTTKLCETVETKGCKPLRDVFTIKNANDLVEHFGTRTSGETTPVDSGSEYGWIEKIINREHLLESLIPKSKVTFNSDITKAVPSNVTTQASSKLSKFGKIALKEIHNKSLLRGSPQLSRLIKQELDSMKKTLLKKADFSETKQYNELMSTIWLDEDKVTQIDTANVSVDVNLIPKSINVLAKGIIQDLISLVETSNPVLAISKVGLSILGKVRTYWDISTKNLAEENTQLGEIQYSIQSATQAAAAAGYGIAKFGFKPGGSYHGVALVALAVFDNLFQMLNILVEIDYYRLFQWEPLGAALSTLFFIWGAFYGVLLPMVPSLIVIFALIGWLILIIEAILASPLIALGLAHPSGQQFFGASEQSTMLLLMLFLRPMLIFLGVVISLVIGHCGLTMLNYAVEVFIADLITGSNWWVDGVMLMMLLVIYGYIAFLVLVQSYAVIGILPDKISAWLGSGPLGGDSPLQQILAVRAGVESSAQKVGQGAGASVADKGSGVMKSNIAGLAQDIDGAEEKGKDLLKSKDKGGGEMHFVIDSDDIDKANKMKEGDKPEGSSDELKGKVKVLKKADIEAGVKNDGIKMNQKEIDDMFTGKNGEPREEIHVLTQDYKGFEKTIMSGLGSKLSGFQKGFLKNILKKTAVNRMKKESAKSKFDMNKYSTPADASAGLSNIFQLFNLF